MGAVPSLTSQWSFGSPLAQLAKVESQPLAQACQPWVALRLSSWQRPIQDQMYDSIR